MPNSPLRSSSEQTLIKESPSRFQNRYTERFKSVLESPPRENTSSSFTAKSSPLRSATPGSQHKIFDNGKYTSFEIPNEDRGEWRELSVKDEVDLINVSASPVRQESFSPKPSHEKKSSATPPQEQQQQQYHVSRPHRVPHYMQATKSFYDKVNNKKEDRRTDNILRPRFKGGITKRVSTSKIPRYRSTTSINAVEDIQSEMTPDDVYVPMAARIKLFEKGLGNGSNKPAPITPKYSRSNSMNNHSPSPSVNSSKQSSSTTTGQRRIQNHNETTDGMPSYLRQTSSSSIKQKEHHASKSTSPQSQPSPTLRKKKEVKPFYFATSKRAEHYESTFNDKLNLWKVKDKQAIENNSNNRGIKRKNTTTTDTSQKHTKHNKTN